MHLFKTLTLLQTVFAVGSIPDHCYSYTGLDPKWQDISNQRQFSRIAANSQSDIIWALTSQYNHHLKGKRLVKYDTSGKWSIDRTQPTGAKDIAVNSKGEPAFVQRVKPNHIYVKVKGWTEIRVCSRGVAFGGKNDTLYRKGCDEYLYFHQEKNNTWTKMGTTRIHTMAVSKD